MKIENNFTLDISKVSLKLMDFQQRRVNISAKITQRRERFADLSIFLIDLKKKGNKYIYPKHFSYLRWISLSNFI